MLLTDEKLQLKSKNTGAVYAKWKKTKLDRTFFRQKIKHSVFLISSSDTNTYIQQQIIQTETKCNSKEKHVIPKHTTEVRFLVVGLSQGIIEILLR